MGIPNIAKSPSELDIAVNNVPQDFKQVLLPKPHLIQVLLQLHILNKGVT